MASQERKSATSEPSSRTKYGLFASLYFAQGLPYGFFTQALPIVLREAQFSLTVIGGTALLTLPWALKFAWAPLVDRLHFNNYGLRKSWIVPLQLLSSVLVLGLSLLDPTQGITAILTAFLFCNFVAAAQDIATDGLAVDLLKGDAEVGWANSFQVGAYRLGMVVGGTAMLFILSWIGWSAAMLAMSALLLASSIPILLFNEPDRTGVVGIRENAGYALPVFKSFFAQSGIWRWLAVLAVYKFAHQSGSSIMRPWLVDRGYSMAEIASVMGVFGSGSGLVGALIGGCVAARTSRPKNLIVLAAMQAVATSAYCIPLFTSHAIWKVGLATVLDHGMSGIATVSLFAAMMDRCRPSHAAADYTLQASTVVISQTLATGVGGLSAETFGYQLHFALVAAVALGVTAFCWKMLRPRAIAIAGAVLLLCLGGPDRAAAQDGGKPNEVGIAFGPFLPNRIGGVREILNGWGLSGTVPTNKGVFELEWFNARGDGTQYHSLLLDYRLDVLGDGSLKMLPVHFLLGIHADYYQPLDQDWRPSGGWHYGGGLRIPVGRTTAFRAEFKHRFSPGQSMIILIGVSFQFGSSEGGN